MINFEQKNNCFNYRIAGVVVHENHVLLQQAEDEDYWTFPGGRAEFNERAEKTLKREICEELDTEVDIVRLLWLVENFFPYAGKNYHEIAFYFLMNLPSASKYLQKTNSFRGMEERTTLVFQWFPIEAGELAKLPLLPSCLQKALQVLPKSIEHIVHYNR